MAMLNSGLGVLFSLVTDFSVNSLVIPRVRRVSPASLEGLSGDRTGDFFFQILSTYLVCLVIKS